MGRVKEKELYRLLKKHQNPDRASQMKAYMRNQFEFLGISAADRRKLMQPFFQSVRSEQTIRWNFVQNCWRSPYREYQYIVIDYLNKKKTLLKPDDLPALKELALKKSWWDTIDALDKLIGHLALRYPEMNDTLLEWSTAENMWLRRIAINHQRHRKEQTDTDLLEQILAANLDQTEFFINKAIGWSLRDYSKTNPEWVKSFIERYGKRMAPLSIREAGKYLHKNV